MGMCAVKGPRVLHEEEQQQQQQVGDGEMSPRSTASSGSYGSASSQEEEVEVQGAEEDSSFVGPLWQRSIPKGRRCKPLSFSGMIVYDENGNQVEVTFEEDEDGDEEYFSPQPRSRAEEAFQAAE